MLPFEGQQLAQKIRAVLDGIVPHLKKNDNNFRLERSWVYGDKVAVFDYLVFGQSVAFDVGVNKFGGLTTEAFGRNQKAKYLIGRAGFKPTVGGRFLIAENEPFVAIDVLGKGAASAIGDAVERILSLGAHPSDVHLMDCVGAIPPLVVVDVGANDLSQPPYASLRQAGLCKIIGFEPQQQAFDDLQKNKREDEQYFPYAIGKSGTTNLNIYAYSGFTSSYKIDERTINIAPSWFGGTRLKETISIQCVGLDDVPGVPKFDLLKIDIQGGELNVFRNARRSLSKAICVITEVGFFPLYEGAPNFADVHNELLKQGFLLHKFLHQIHVSVDSLENMGSSRVLSTSQIIDGDAVYLRDYRDMKNLRSEELFKYALLGHFVFDSQDFTARMLRELVHRGVLDMELVDKYIESLSLVQ